MTFTLNGGLVPGVEYRLAGWGRSNPVGPSADDPTDEPTGGPESPPADAEPSDEGASDGTEPAPSEKGESDQVKADESPDSDETDMWYSWSWS